ncbi:hypothetical protein QC761_0068880 [Podospora bellae-mahoneyi]|uniref:Uncharacterized protein n=1 Tax=Podospora bellae-mahoneyi TaxID=2093777 RepID=A0ABR0FHU6_9PEZI|nr:hypothetical protein QC761_0068880 [Podospora bellae-mahoneyi]
MWDGSRVGRLMIGARVNELFSLKKELKDGAAMNLVSIAMHDRNRDLAGAVGGILGDYGHWGCEFRNLATRFRARAKEEHGGEVMEMVEKTIEAYEAVVTAILEFSVQSPRYGIKQYQREDGYFEIPL